MSEKKKPDADSHETAVPETEANEPVAVVQRLFLAVAAVSGNESVLEELLDGAERILFASEFEVGEVRRPISKTG